MKTEIEQKLEQRINNWWLGILVGIVAVGLGIWCASAPAQTLIALGLVFIVSFIVSGITNIALAITNRNFKSWGWVLASGILDILIAGAFISMPGITLTFMIMFVGIWVLFQSILGIKISSELKKNGVGGSVITLVLSVVGIILSFILITNPVFTSGVIVMLTSITFITYGILRIYYGFQLRKIKKLRDRGYM